ncbi:MAG: thioredoxin family protein [Pseudobacter sp.]|uniref:thioredoxin family protein n=1 Tax=Pseudobacter sp. TaxID=2045420 RepID=UPI003F7F5269
MKRLLTLVLITVCCAPGLVAQDKGLQFFHGSWAELKAEAKRTNKLIFVDVYTDWCGPCKKMVALVFPLKEVGDKYNPGFINYKLDAEKGEGPELAKQFSVQGFPTYLYLNSDGDLIHRGIGYFEADKFNKNADIAISSANDPNSIGKMTQKYESGVWDKAFLHAYAQKLIDLELSPAKALDEYFPLLTNAEKASPEIKKLFLRGLGINNPAIMNWLLTDVQELSRISRESNIRNAFGSTLYDQLYSQLSMSASKAVQAAEWEEYLLYREYLKQLGGETAMHNVNAISRMDMSYYAAAGKIDSLKPQADKFVAETWNMPVDSIRARDARELARFMKPYLDGSKDSTKNDYFQSMKYSASGKFAMDAAINLNSAAEGFATTKASVKKQWLKQAYDWNRRAVLLTPESVKYHFTEARLLAKLGKKKEGVKIMDGLIEKAKKNNNKALQENLEKIRSDLK